MIYNIFAQHINISIFKCYEEKCMYNKRYQNYRGKM